MSSKFFKVFAFLLFPIFFYGQGFPAEKRTQIALEYTISGNAAFQSEGAPKLGVGLATNVYLQMNSISSVIIGLGYDRSHFFEKDLYRSLTTRAENFNFIFNTISLNIGLRFKGRGKYQPLVEFGFSPNYHVGSHLKGVEYNTTFGSTTGAYNQVDSINEFYKPYVGGALFAGIGLLSHLKYFDLVVKGDVKHGFKDYTANSPDQSFRNRYVRLSVGIRKDLSFKL